MIKINVGEELLKKAPNSNLLYHQYRTVNALRNNSVVFNTYPTGAGKTRAALERLKENYNDNVLFIAPTNELLVQHEEDIRSFIISNNLNYKVVRIDASVISKIKQDLRYRHLRRGTILYELLRNPLEYEEFLDFDYLKDMSGKVIVVVNPDIFYYCVYGLYGRLDKGNLMEILISKFNYIVIDEFHYYNAKQLVNFLFFMILSKEFGYFNYERKICILTATPDKLIEQYLKRGDIDYEIISKENEPQESEEFQKLKTLSKMELTITNSSIEEIVKEYYKDKNNNLKDSVVISESMIKVTKIKESLKDMGFNEENIGVITGAICSKERKGAVQKKIILATPTVDIGYNFKKQNKLTQNIDEVITEAKTSDQALQRIGRAGRILGKQNQENISKVIMCVNDEAYNKLSEITSNFNSEEITRKHLKEIIEIVLPQRQILKKYIETGAILELCFPLDELYKDFTYRDREDIIGKTFNDLIEVFAPRKNFNFKTMVNKVRDYKNGCNLILEYNSNKEDNSLFTEKFKTLINSSFIMEALNELRDGNLEESDLDLTKEELNEVITEYKEVLIEYLKRKNSIIKSLINFRGSNMGMPLLVFDKFNILTQEERIFKYDIFHLLRYYDLYWYKDKQEFSKYTKYKFEGNTYDNINAYVKVNNIKENPCEIGLEYNFDGSKLEFERYYLNDIKSINNLMLTIKEKNKLGKELGYIPEKIREIFANEYIPILIIKNSKERYQVSKLIKNQHIFMQKLKVNFFNGSNSEYEVITGSSAILVDYSLVKLKDKLNPTESFIM